MANRKKPGIFERVRRGTPAYREYEKATQKEYLQKKGRKTQTYRVKAREEKARAEYEEQRTRRKKALATRPTIGKAIGKTIAGAAAKQARRTPRRFYPPRRRAEPKRYRQPLEETPYEPEAELGDYILGTNAGGRRRGRGPQTIEDFL